MSTHHHDISPTTARRWEAEASYFDDLAHEPVRPIGEGIVARYSNVTLSSKYPLEYQFALAGSLKGRSVLDVGCGTGQTSVLMALMGANVTGVDISPVSIERARELAALHSLHHNVEFLCAPLEAVRLPSAVDLVWIEAFLHHVPDIIDQVMSHIRSAVGPGIEIIIREPVIPTTAALIARNVIPIPKNGTPDERPLRQRELRQIASFVPDISSRSFAIFSRLERILPRSTVSQLYSMDTLVPKSLMDRFGAVSVMHGHLG